MRSNRLAILAVAVGSALLGSSAAGVNAVAGNLAKSSAPPTVQKDWPDRDHRDGHDHRGARGL